MTEVVYSRDEALLVSGKREYVFVPTPDLQCRNCEFRGRMMVHRMLYGVYWFNCRFPARGPERKCKKTFRKDVSYGHWRLKDEN